jgi:succinate dehydrogenase / fumarate reductase, membrane anchor subunit
MSLSPKNHWLALRATAIAAIPLSIWFVYSIVHISGTDYATFTTWLKQPLNAGLLILFIIITFWHASLGVHEIIEDYMHGKIKNISLKTKAIIFALLALVCVVAVFKVSQSQTQNSAGAAVETPAASNEIPAPKRRILRPQTSPDANEPTRVNND